MLPIDAIHSILIVRPDAIGDMILTLPAIKAIKEKYPDKKIIVWASEINKQVILDEDYIDEIITPPQPRTWQEKRDFIKTINKLSIDCAIHYYSESHTAWPLYFSNISYHIGDKAKLGLWPIYRKFGIFHKSFNQLMHVVDYNFELLRHLDVHLTPQTKLSLNVAPNDTQQAKARLQSLSLSLDHPLICIHAGVGFGNRPITPEKIITYIQACSQKIKNCQFILTGKSTKEQETIQSIINEAPQCLGITDASLPELKAIISLSHVFVSVDTGPFHMAAALGTAQLAIFPSKKVKPINWAPFRNQHLIIRESHTCEHYCPHQHCPLDICSDAISAQKMVNYTEKLLQGNGITRNFKAYWFQQSITLLVLYNDHTLTTQKEFSQFLDTYRIRYIKHHYDDPNILQSIKENNISIIHNLPGKKKLLWTLYSQKANSFLHNPPLVVHRNTAFHSLQELLDLYTLKFKEKKI